MLKSMKKGRDLAFLFAILYIRKFVPNSFPVVFKHANFLYQSIAIFVIIRLNNYQVIIFAFIKFKIIFIVVN